MSMSLTTTMGKPSQDPEPTDNVTAILLTLRDSYLGQPHFWPASDKALGRGAAQGPQMLKRWESLGFEQVVQTWPCCGKRGNTADILRFNYCCYNKKGLKRNKAAAYLILTG